MSDLRRACVFCGSSPGERPEYRDAAHALGARLADRGVGLVYGGASVGLMGAVANAVIDGGGHVVGVIPEGLFERELAHQGLSDLRVVQTMHERKQEMYALADGFIALPGGLGTLEEVFEAATWNQLGLHPRLKPLVLLDVADYWRDLVSFLDSTVEQGFVKERWRSTLHLACSADEAIDLAIGSDGRRPSGR